MCSATGSSQRVLAEDYGEPAAALMAAQVTACMLTLQERYFHRLVSGTSLEEAGRGLTEDVEIAFALLEHGIDHTKGQ